MKKKKSTFFLSLLLHMFSLVCTAEELNSAPWNLRCQLLRFERIYSWANFKLSLLQLIVLFITAEIFRDKGVTG